MNKSRRPKGSNKPGHRRGKLPLSKRLKPSQKEARSDKLFERAVERDIAIRQAVLEARKAKKATPKED